MQLRQRRLQLHRMLVVAGDVAGAARSGAVLVQRAMHRLQHLPVTAHAQVVVGAPHRHFLLWRRHVRAGEFLCQPIDVVEVAVRLIAVLLIQLALIERFIVELARRRGRLRPRARKRHAAGSSDRPRMRRGCLQRGRLGACLLLLVRGRRVHARRIAGGCVQGAARGSLPLLARGGQTLGRPDLGSGGGREALRGEVAGALHGQRLAHDGAAASNDLEVGNGASAGAAAGPGRGRQRAQRCGRRVLEERAHGPGLIEQGFHVAGGNRDNCHLSSSV